MPRRGWNEPRRVNPAVPSEILKKRRDRGAAGGQAGSAGQGLPLSNPCRSPAAGKMKLPGCRANETFSAPGSRSERNQRPLAQRTKPSPCPVRAANEISVRWRSERNLLSARFAQRTKSAPVGAANETFSVPVRAANEISARFAQRTKPSPNSRKKRINGPQPVNPLNLPKALNQWSSGWRYRLLLRY